VVALAAEDVPLDAPAPAGRLSTTPAPAPINIAPVIPATANLLCRFMSITVVSERMSKREAR